MDEVISSFREFDPHFTMPLGRELRSFGWKAGRSKRKWNLALPGGRTLQLDLRTSQHGVIPDAGSVFHAYLIFLVPGTNERAPGAPYSLETAGTIACRRDWLRISAAIVERTPGYRALGRDPLASVVRPSVVGTTFEEMWRAGCLRKNDTPPYRFYRVDDLVEWRAYFARWLPSSLARLAELDESGARLPEPPDAPPT